MQTTELIVLRHGETDWNRERRVQGQLDTPLNAAGQRQALAAARRLAADAATLGLHSNGPGGGAVLISSDLMRCRQTAEPIGVALGLACRLDPRFRERAFGVLEGRTPAELQGSHPLYHQRWRERDPDCGLGGGESLRVFADRIAAALDDLIASCEHRTVVLVTHGGVLDVLHRRARGLTLEAPRDFEIPNASLNRLRWSAKGLEILEWGTVSHWRDALDEIGRR
jgi:probable phosphoglycerate mutase